MLQKTRNKRCQVRYWKSIASLTLVILLLLSTSANITNSDLSFAKKDTADNKNDLMVSKTLKNNNTSLSFDNNSSAVGENVLGIKPVKAGTMKALCPARPPLLVLLASNH